MKRSKQANLFKLSLFICTKILSKEESLGTDQHTCHSTEKRAVKRAPLYTQTQHVWMGFGVRVLPHGVRCFFSSNTLSPNVNWQISPAYPAKKITQTTLFVKGGRQEDAKHSQIKNYRHLNVCLFAKVLQTHKCSGRVRGAACVTGVLFIARFYPESLTPKGHTLSSRHHKINEDKQEEKVC